MKVELFDFDLPERLIAQVPLKERDASRLMVLDKKTGEITHSTFKHVIDFLNAGDCIVLNDTRVLPARLYGVKEETGAKVEVLLLKQEEGDVWETLVKPAKRVKRGTVLSFGDGRLTAVCTEELEHGGRKIEFRYEGIFTRCSSRSVKCLCLLILKNSSMTGSAIRRFTQRNKDRRLRRRPGCILRKRFSMRSGKKACILRLSPFMSVLGHSGLSVRKM